LASRSTTQPELLELALSAHGGLDRWRAIRSITATINVSGAVFALKGHPEGLGGPVQATADTSAPRTTFTPFPGGEQGVFEPDRVTLTKAGGETQTRTDPRAAFADHELNTPWDELDLLYFLGYGIWNYLAAPFMFTRPGFELEEIEPWQEDAESWRRLRVAFPAELPTHCPEQVFYFDAAGLLRRIDYQPEVVSPQSPIPGAHYCHDHKTYSGLSVPTRRRVYPRLEDGSAAQDQPVVELDVEDVTVNA
jgi:hypothetical protein